MEPTGPLLLRPGFLRSPFSPRAPDCFFQLGNLTFAEADYQQALALSPRDEGAHLRMGLLQEKLGFCEHQSRCEPMVGGAAPWAGHTGLWAGPGKSGMKPPAWAPWVKTSLLSQLSLLNINFIFQVFAKNPSLFSEYCYGNWAFIIIIF